MLATDAANADELRGQLWVLSGAGEVPADVEEYRRDHRAHRVPVRADAFEERELTPGPVLLVLDLRGRGRTTANAVIPAGGVLELDLTAGARQ